MPRKRHVSRNLYILHPVASSSVMPRKRHVSRNEAFKELKIDLPASCLARGM